MVISYHEPVNELSEGTRELHRALTSITEELEAIDWYQQRVDAMQDESLKAVLVHNRDEEIEHAAMVLEWVRRRMPEFDEALRTYLFTEKPITQVEEEAEAGSGEGPGDASPKSLGIGKFTRKS